MTRAVDRAAIGRLAGGLAEAARAIDRVLAESSRARRAALADLEDAAARMTEAMTAPRELVRDADGEIVGSRVIIDGEERI